MKTDLRNKIIEENKYISLLKENSQFRLQGSDPKTNKKVVGIIKGDVTEYKPYRDHLDYEYFNTWKEAYKCLVG